MDDIQLYTLVLALPRTGSSYFGLDNPVDSCARFHSCIRNPVCVDSAGMAGGGAMTRGGPSTRGGRPIF